MVRNPWLWIGVSVVISIAAAVSLPQLKFDYNLLDLDDPNADSVKALYEVMDASKNDEGNQVSTIYASVVADNLDEARDLSRKLLALPVVAKVDSILDLVPEGQDKKMPIIQRIVASAAALNVKPSTRKSVDIPRARYDIGSPLSRGQGRASNCATGLHGHFPYRERCRGRRLARWCLRSNGRTRR